MSAIRATSQTNTLFYVQSTGEIFDAKNVFGDGDQPQQLARGYSGIGQEKNRPSSQADNLGPIPRGWYDIRSADISGLESAIALEPDQTNEMFERTGFLIYGDNDTTPGWASAGSIVIDGKDNRAAILRYDRLHVIASPPIKLSHFPHPHGKLGVVISDQGTRPFFLGHGYRTFAAAPGRMAEEFGERVISDGSPVLPPTGAMVQMTFGVLASKQDFDSAFSVDAELSGGYGALSVKAQTTLSRSYSRSLVTVTIAFTKQVVRGVYRINFEDCQLDQAALTTAAAGADDFVRVYGDSVINGVGLGGACCYMFQYVFSSETQASDFKASLGASYGTVFGGSISAEQKQLLSTAQASISLCGYSTGTTNVPSLVKNVGIFQEKNFVFSSDFSDEIMQNLIDFFDNFEANFPDPAGDSPLAQGYTQVFVDPTPLSLLPLPDALKNQDRILKISFQAIDIARDLAKRRERADKLFNQLAYMQSALSEYNTPESRELAAKISADLEEVGQEIDDRLTVLIEQMDLSGYDFVIPTLPVAFCTVDPELRPFDDENVTMERWVIYPFSDTATDQGRTCNVTATAAFYVSGCNTGYGIATLRLLKNKKDIGRPVGPTPVSDTKADWDTIEELQLYTGPDQGESYLTVPSKTPEVFISSPKDIYAVGILYQFKLSGHAMRLKTYLSKQAKN